MSEEMEKLEFESYDFFQELGNTNNNDHPFYQYQQEYQYHEQQYLFYQQQLQYHKYQEQFYHQQYLFYQQEFQLHKIPIQRLPNNKNIQKSDHMDTTNIHPKLQPNTANIIQLKHKKANAYHEKHFLLEFVLDTLFDKNKNLDQMLTIVSRPVKQIINKKNGLIEQKYGAGRCLDFETLKIEILDKTKSKISIEFYAKIKKQTQYFFESEFVEIVVCFQGWNLCSQIFQALL